METIRKKYYILLTSLALLMCILCVLIPISAMKRVESIYRDHTEGTIFEIKKSFLKDSVNNMILIIESTQADTIEKYQQRGKRLATRFEKTIQVHPGDFIELAKISFNDSQNKGAFTVLILDEETKEIMYENKLPSFFEKKNLEKSFGLLKERTIFYQEIHKEGYCLIIAILEEMIDQEIKDYITKRIHGEQFSNGAYIWVNEVLNYKGGDDYAIRRIHPNLIETEGMYLSTSMVDIKGKTPYLTELQGVITKGEVFSTYHFKKREDHEISEKLTYAKLYEKYNWIVAMGVHLDDIQLYSDAIIQDSDRVITKMIFSIIALAIGIFTISALYLAILERWYYRKSNKKFNEELNIDTLTKAYNRRAGTLALEKSFSRYKKDSLIQAIIMFDIDDFKKVNDRYGHDNGDIVLQKIVQAVQGCIRNTDMLYRWGGEEFLLTCEGLRPENAMGFSKKALKEVERVQYKDGEETYHVSISMGVSYFQPEDLDYNDAIKRADIALYEAKRNGKNQVKLNIGRK